jgi:hypothetical protein
VFSIVNILLDNLAVNKKSITDGSAPNMAPTELADETIVTYPVGNQPTHGIPGLNVIYPGTRAAFKLRRTVIGVAATMNRMKQVGITVWNVPAHNGATQRLLVSCESPLGYLAGGYRRGTEIHMQEVSRAIGNSPHVISNVDIFLVAYFRTPWLFAFKNLGKVVQFLLGITIVVKVLINRRTAFVQGNLDILFESAYYFIPLINIIALTIDITELARFFAA